MSGTVTPCADGAAHPNVCCTAGPDQAGSCLTYPAAPFTQCDPGATTYPDPRACCPLDGSGACAAPPPPPLDGGVAGGGGGGSVGGGCAYACPPGWYTPAGASSDTCCQTDSSGATLCSASGGANGSGPCGGSCTCPACPPDSGACPPCDCPPTPCPTNPPPACGSCPPGWQTPQGQPDLCCTTDASGEIECFSQAGPPGGGPVPTDAGTGPTVGSCSGSASTDGAIGPCGCQEAANGHTYAVDCQPDTNLCTCTEDSVPLRTFPDNGNTCGNMTALFTSCGFPVN